MSKEEAIKIIMTKYPTRIIGKVTETDRYFLVDVLSRPKNYNDILYATTYDNSLKAVDKETKQVFTYNPIRHK